MESFSIDFTGIIFAAIVIAALFFGLVALGYVVFIFFKNRKREEVSIDSVLLQVAVPRNNEFKIDVMDQLIAGIYSIKKGGWKQKFDIQPTVSFEIVAKQEDVRFYVWAPKKIKDLVEKQIHGSYPDCLANPAGCRGRRGCRATRVP